VPAKPGEDRARGRCDDPVLGRGWAVERVYFVGLMLQFGSSDVCCVCGVGVCGDGGEEVSQQPDSNWGGEDCLPAAGGQTNRIEQRAN